MLVNKFIQALTFASLASAFVIPAGSTDGTYTVHIDERGVEVHQKLESIVHRDVSGVSNSSPNPASKLQARSGSWYCGCGYNMDHNNCDDAVADLKSQISGANGQLPKDLNYYSIKGAVVAFLCNEGPLLAINSGDLTALFASITNECGWYVAGTYRSLDGAYDWRLGYMQYYSGLDFCAAATSSSASRC